MKEKNYSKTSLKPTNTHRKIQRREKLSKHMIYLLLSSVLLSVQCKLGQNLSFGGISPEMTTPSNFQRILTPGLQTRRLTEEDDSTTPHPFTIKIDTKNLEPVYSKLDQGKNLK